MGQTSDAIDSTGAMFRAFGSVVSTKRTTSNQLGCDACALEYFAKLMQWLPPEVYAWDDAGNNRWLISGKGSAIMNPPSAWTVAKRDNPKVAEQVWHHDMPKGPAGRFRGSAAVLLRSVGVLQE